VSYTFLRLGVEARIGVTDAFDIGAHFAYRPVLSAGEIQSADWFSRATASGIDIGLLLSYELVPSFDVLLMGDIRRYGYSMNSHPSDARIAGGAADQSLSASVGASFHL